MLTTEFGFEYFDSRTVFRHERESDSLGCNKKPGGGPHVLQRGETRALWQHVRQQSLALLKPHAAHAPRSIRVPGPRPGPVAPGVRPVAPGQ